MPAPAGILLSELRHVVEDLQSLVGRPVLSARVPSPTALVLELGGGVLLYLESHPFPRIHPIARRPRNPRTPFSFQGLLRSRLRGPLTAIEVVGDDRVVEVEIASRYRLHARLVGQGGGIWLLDHDRVLGASDGPAEASLPPMPDGVPSEAPPRFEPTEDQDWASAAADWFTRHAAEARRDALRMHVRRALKPKHQKARRLVARLTDDLARTDRAAVLRREADALASALHTIHRGQTEVTLNDPEGGPEPVVVALDPARTPADEMTRRYETARRLSAARDDIETRLLEARKREQALAGAREEVDEGSPEQLRAWIRVFDLPAADASRVADTRTEPWETWKGPHGQVVWIGRNAAANHALTFGRARGRDWWLHVRERPGAHAVLPMAQRGDTPDLEHLLAAARILLRLGRIAEGEPHDVQYTRVADLRSVKGVPGKAIVTREKVLHVAWCDDDLTGWHRRS